MKLPAVFTKMHHGLVVSCQALEDEPLHGAQIMAAMARAAVQGGAAGIRANGPADIAAIRAAVDVPLIGLYKAQVEGYEPYITPTLEHAQAVAEAGADIIALDATLRLHPQDLNADALIQLVRETTGLPVLADVATLQEGIAAWKAGADAVSTTLSGYTPQSPKQEAPDFELLRRLAAELPVPVFAEGRISLPEQAAQALAFGAFAVVVGGAITRPQVITRTFAQAIRKGANDAD